MTMVEVEWRVCTDASLSDTIARGVFPALWLRKDDTVSSGESIGVAVSTLHPEIIPEIRREAEKLLQLEGSEIKECSFQLKASALGLRAADGSDDLYCALKASGQPDAIADEESRLHASWFDAKLHRAEFHRQRGNDRFKADEIQRAVSAYKRALDWLECPKSKCKFSSEEEERVNAIAIPCHANLGTCHWKLANMDACIDHASRALGPDPSHTKARYRRSQAYLQTKQFDVAVEDLEAVVATDPDSKLFASSLAKAKHAKQQHKAKQKQALASAFSE